MSDSFLSQEEIDALLNQGPDAFGPKDDLPETPSGRATATEFTGELGEMEKDALGEIANISMGSAATALSQLLNQRVDITTPQVRITTLEDIYASFQVPYVMIEVNFDEGLRGSNLLILKVRDISIIADLMMGGDGKNPSEELTEMTMSAIAEAMNQMIGSAATSMSEMFHKGIKISPPAVRPVDFDGEAYEAAFIDDAIVVVSFKMVIGKLLDSELMQLIPLDVAREEIGLLMGGMTSPETVPLEKAEPEGKQQRDETDKQVKKNPHAIDAEEQQNLNLILDIPLRLSVVLGRTKKSIGEVLGFSSGSIVELEKLADEPVEILVNGTLIARGEVVIVNENFGVRVNNIVSPEERLNNLRK